MDMIRRLATSQTRGDRQLSFVNELLIFQPVFFKYYEIPGHPGTSTVLLGVSKLQSRSWRNLKKRLISVGFIFDTDWQQQSIRMHFPEAGL